MLLDRSGQGKVYQLISRRRFQQMEVQWDLDLRKPGLRKNLDLRKIVATNNFFLQKLFDFRKIF